MVVLARMVNAYAHKIMKEICVKPWVRNDVMIKVSVMNAEGCGFNYRTSIFPN